MRRAAAVLERGGRQDGDPRLRRARLARGRPDDYVAARRAGRGGRQRRHAVVRAPGLRAGRCSSLGRLHEQAAADPELAARPVVKALLAGDLEGAAALRPGGGRRRPAEHPRRADRPRSSPPRPREWLAEAEHPRFGARFGELAYAPMLELARPAARPRLPRVRRHRRRRRVRPRRQRRALRRRPRRRGRLGGAGRPSSAATGASSSCARPALLGSPNEGRAQADQHPEPHRPPPDPRRGQQRRRPRDARVRPHRRAARPCAS